MISFVHSYLFKMQTRITNSTQQKKEAFEKQGVFHLFLTLVPSCIEPFQKIIFPITEEIIESLNANNLY